MFDFNLIVAFVHAQPRCVDYNKMSLKPPAFVQTNVCKQFKINHC
jgi:hypothetical protein